MTTIKKPFLRFLWVWLFLFSAIMAFAQKGFEVKGTVLDNLIMRAILQSVPLCKIFPMALLQSWTSKDTFHLLLHLPQQN